MALTFNFSFMNLAQLHKQTLINDLEKFIDYYPGFCCDIDFRQFDDEFYEENNRVTLNSDRVLPH